MPVKEKETTLTGKLGTLSYLEITNNSGLPVSLEIRIPKQRSMETSDQWPVFTTFAAEPGCHLKKEEIQLSNGGLLTGEQVGSVEIARFPPDCSLEVTIASSQVNELARFMNGRVEVFYDGKKAEIDRPTKVYGVVGQYIRHAQKGGVVVVFVSVLLPALLIIFGIVWLMESLPRKMARKAEDEKGA